MLERKGLHNEILFTTLFAYTLMICIHLIECILFYDTEAPLLHCFPFNSQLNAREVINARENMKNQTFSNLQTKWLHKNFFHSILIELRDTSEKIRFSSVSITRFVLIFRKTSNIHFERKRRYKIVTSEEVDIPFRKVIGRQRGRWLGALAKGIARITVFFCVSISSQLYSVSVLTCWNLLCKNLQSFSAEEKNFNTSAEIVGLQARRKRLGLSRGSWRQTQA